MTITTGNSLLTAFSLCSETGVRCYAWALLSNHSHLKAEPAKMKEIIGAIEELITATQQCPDRFLHSALLPLSLALSHQGRGRRGVGGAGGGCIATVSSPNTKMQFLNRTLPTATLNFQPSAHCCAMMAGPPA
jgi:hypothetical protein